MKQQVRRISLLLTLFLVSCATTPPKRINNLCHIFSEKDDWLEEVQAASKKWGVKVSTIMAFMHQESKFRHDALPPEKPYFLWLIPRGRVSSAYGYAQAIDGTWKEYQRATGNSGADRDDFEDAVDFIGWYIHRSNRKLKIAKHNAYHQYLAYHEGPHGYQKRSYRKKKWLRKVARKVASLDKRYQRQYRSCHH